jgi:hypothetical protein
MLEGLKALSHSEKAIVGGTLVIAATVLVIVGAMSVDQWSSYTQTIFLGYIAGKTVQGAVSTWTTPKVIDATKPSAKTEVTIETKSTEVNNVGA